MSTGINHGARSHARFSPSAIARTEQCPGWMRMAERLVQGGSSIAANHGTCAHELSERCLSTGQDPAEFEGWVIDLNQQDDKRIAESGQPDGVTGFLVDAEMIEGVKTYIEAIALVADGTDWEIDYEVRVDLRHIHPDCYGTGDVVAYHPATKHLMIGDLKFGRHIVEPNSVQLLTYAIGAAHRLSNRGVDKVTCMIVQPNAFHPAGRVRFAELDSFDLLEGEDRLRAVMAAAEQPDAPVVAGPYCTFCPAMAECPVYLAALGGDAVDLSNAANKPVVMPDITTLSPDQVAMLVENSGKVTAWFTSVNRMAREMAMAGRVPTGLKLVYGRKLRKWASDDLVKATFDCLGLDESDYATTKLATPAALEKRWGKKIAAERMVGLMDDKLPNLSLVPLSDARPAVSAPGTGLQPVDEE